MFWPPELGLAPADLEAELAPADIPPMIVPAVDPCKDIICITVGEICAAGACMCGSSPTCSGNLQAPTCDAGINICRCGSGGPCEAPDICDEVKNECMSSP